MKKYIICLILFFTVQACLAYSENYILSHKQKPPNKEKIKEFDVYLDSRLHLTKEQKESLKQNRIKCNKETKKIIAQMQKTHDKIRNIYLTGIPPFQAKIRTAPYKAELTILMQQFKKIKEDSRKEFEKILTADQKLEFEKIKQEIKEKKPKINHYKKESK